MKVEASPVRCTPHSVTGVSPDPVVSVVRDANVFRVHVNMSRRWRPVALAARRCPVRGSLAGHALSGPRAEARVPSFFCVLTFSAGTARPLPLLSVTTHRYRSHRLATVPAPAARLVRTFLTGIEVASGGLLLAYICQANCTQPSWTGESAQRP